LIGARGGRVDKRQRNLLIAWTVILLVLLPGISFVFALMVRP
jgi:hypothetical protein